MVPVKTADKKASTIISVTRLPTTRADQEATRLKCALAKVNAPFGGHRNGMYSVNVDEAPERPGKSASVRHVQFGSLNAKCDSCVTNLNSATRAQVLGGSVIPQTLLFFRRTHGWVVGGGQL